MLAIFAGYYFCANRGGAAQAAETDDSYDRARLLADRSDPRKFWAQAAIALYQDDSDPGYWKRENALQPGVRQTPQHLLGTCHG